MPAMACHMIAAFSALYEQTTTRTPLPVFEVSLEVLITWALMSRQLTLFTESYPTVSALETVEKVDNSLTVFSRTET